MSSAQKSESVNCYSCTHLITAKCLDCDNFEHYEEWTKEDYIKQAKALAIMENMGIMIKEALNEVDKDRTI